MRQPIDRQRSLRSSPAVKCRVPLAHNSAPATLSTRGCQERPPGRAHDPNAGRRAGLGAAASLTNTPSLRDRAPLDPASPISKAPAAPGERFCPVGPPGSWLAATTPASAEHVVATRRRAAARPSLARPHPRHTLRRLRSPTCGSGLARGASAGLRAPLVVARCHRPWATSNAATKQIIDQSTTVIMLWDLRARS